MCDRMGCTRMDHSGLKTWLDKRDIHAFLRSIEHALNVQGFAWWNSTTIFIDTTHFRAVSSKWWRIRFRIDRVSEGTWEVHYVCRIRRTSDCCCLKHANHYSIISRICRMIEKCIDSTKWSVGRQCIHLRSNITDWKTCRDGRNCFYFGQQASPFTPSRHLRQIAQNKNFMKKYDGNEWPKKAEKINCKRRGKNGRNCFLPY